jgi:hypothetical protein
MKSIKLNNLAAIELDKKQMNQITGGNMKQTCGCTCAGNDVNVTNNGAANAHNAK